MSKRIKRILTLDDLYNFYFSKNENCNFSAKETGYKLSVQVPAQFEINSEQNDDSLLFCKVKLMHSGENRNHSSVTDEALTKAAKCLAYKPILANFVEYIDPETNETLKDFTSHDMILNDDGTVTYLEKQIGCFTSDESYFEIEEETGHNFLYGYCAIPREYTDACSVIERKGGTKVSVELEINEMQYSVTNKVLELTDITIMGATCLGKNAITLNDVEEGMKNARLDIADFSSDKNSIKFDRDEKLIELLETLNNTLSNFNKENIKEGGNETNMNLFEKLLEKYSKTVEDITFEYESMSDEELEQKFAELFEEDETNTDNAGGEPSDDGEGDGAGEEKSDEGSDDDNDSDDNSDGEREGNEQFEKLVRNFELSHDDIRYALYNLLIPYEESNDEYYWIMEVFDSYFVYQGYSGKVYGQKYTKDGDNVAFDGERYELFLEYLTESEKTALAEMRSNYAVLKEFKETVEKNELIAQKNELINSEKYAVITEKDENGKYINEAFAKLVSEMDNYSLAELETQIKVIHSDFMAENSNFSAKPESKMSSVKVFANPNNKAKPKKRYGNLFD